MEMYTAIQRRGTVGEYGYRREVVKGSGVRRLRWSTFTPASPLAESDHKLVLTREEICTAIPN